jgi:hypothetical protein
MNAVYRSLLRLAPDGALVLPAVAWAVWLGLVTWRLADVPGLDLDEAWYFLSAWGQTPRADPLSGMTRYSGVLPILVIEAFGRRAPWILLRLVGVSCNALALLVVHQWLRRRHPIRAIRGWAVPLLATTPVCLIFSRNATETAMLGPLLTVVGFFWLSLGKRWSPSAAGVVWGIAAYNHVLWAFVPISALGAWFAVYRRIPRVRWFALVAGLLAGGSPRWLSLLLYLGRPAGGPGETWQLGSAISDLPALPGVFWDFINGRTLYLRFVGHESVTVLPYWLAALGFAVPWLKVPWVLPRSVRVSLLTAFILTVTTALFSPLLACRYLIAPTFALAFALADLGAAAIARDAHWILLIRSSAAVLIATNLFYVSTNFLAPWATERIRITRFTMGKRNPSESNYPFLPRGPLLKALRKLAPQQILATPTLERPLRVLLANDPVRVCLPSAMLPHLRTVLLAYQEGEVQRQLCVDAAIGQACFAKPIDVDGEYLIYQHDPPSP